MVGGPSTPCSFVWKEQFFSVRDSFLIFNWGIKGVAWKIWWVVSQILCQVLTQMIFHNCLYIFLKKGWKWRNSQVEKRMVMRIHIQISQTLPPTTNGEPIFRSRWFFPEYCIFLIKQLMKTLDRNAILLENKRFPVRQTSFWMF